MEQAMAAIDLVEAGVIIASMVKILSCRSCPAIRRKGDRS